MRSSPETPLYLARDEIVASVRGSTTTRAHEVADALDRFLLANERRATAGVNSANKNAARYHVAVDSAVQAVMPKYRPVLGLALPKNTASRIERNLRRVGTTEWLAGHNLDRVPDIRAIRASLDRIHAAKK